MRRPGALRPFVVSHYERHMTATRSPVKARKRVIVRFAGDSGDGMQLAGSRFTDATAEHGNDFATLPSFPAEIRAPAGTLAGVSAFQIHFASQDILTPGDEPDVLVAMNPAALRSEPAGARARRDGDRQRGRVQQAQPQQGRLRDQPARGRLARRPPPDPDPDDLADRERRRGDGGRLDARRAGAPRTCSRSASCRGSTTARRSATEDWLRRKFVDKPGSLEANLAAFRAGWNFGETSELIDVQYRVDPATDVPPGTYRNVNGTTATALGLLAASVGHGLPLVLASYPITPASELLHELGAPPGPRRADDPGRGRDRRRRHGARRGVRRRPRRHRDERPRHGPQGRDDRARGRARAAADRDRRAARRPVDRACRPRPSSPTC